MDTLLLHGLGATSAVWDGLIERLDHRCFAPDLPGHAGSGRLHRWTFGAFAAAIADFQPTTGPLIVVGHSLGGAIALTLAAGWFGLDIAGVLALGVKVEWSDRDLARAAAMATAPPWVFDTQDKAEQAFRKLSGVSKVDPKAVVQFDDGWHLTFNFAAFGTGAPDVAGMLRAVRCPVVLAAGEHDPMCRPEQLRALREDAVTLPGLGHNAHVEDPAALLPLLDRLYSLTNS